eukprot:Sdes_comp17559_c0_seq1m6799
MSVLCLSSEGISFRSRLEASSSFINKMVNLIPASHYISAISEEKKLMGCKFMHNKKTRPSQEEINTKKKAAKFSKLDPENQKTIEQIQLELAENEVKSKESLEEENQTSPLEVEKKPMHGLSFDANKAGTLEELRSKLQNRIHELRKKRKYQQGDSASSDVVEKNRAEKRQKKSKSTIKEANKLNDSKAGKAVIADTKEKMTKCDGPESMPVFSKFDFGKIEKEKKQSSSNTAKNFQAILLKAQKTKEFEEGLKKSIIELEKKESKSQEEVAQLEELKAKSIKFTYEKAMKKASGEKLKDDPKLVKKTIKRQEREKLKSKKKWNDRIRTVDENLKQKQKSREENLQMRMLSKKRKGEKGKKGTKKVEKRLAEMKNRPGFEGRKTKVGKKKSA